jgi:hypothetical protein
VSEPSSRTADEVGRPGLKDRGHGETRDGAPFAGGGAARRDAGSGDFARGEAARARCKD